MIRARTLAAVAVAALLGLATPASSDEAAPETAAQQRNRAVLHVEGMT
jgi:hypothetical protein